MTDPNLVRREQIRRALAAVDGFNYEHLEPWDYQSHADAILALPAAPVAVDRAAILREVEDHFRRKFRVALTVEQLIDELRGLADETQQPDICELPHLAIEEEEACEQDRLDAQARQADGAGEADHA